MPRTVYSGNYTTMAGSTTQIPTVIDAIILTSPDGATVYRWATASTSYRLISPNTYQPRLRRVGSLTMSLNGGFGRVSFVLTNADLDESERVANDLDKYVGYSVDYTKILQGTVSGNPAEAGVQMLAGIVTGYKLDESGIELDVVTRANRSPVLSNRRVGSKCPWVFKGTECGYSGGLTTCNKLYSDSGGCSGRSNQHRFGGFPSRSEIASLGTVTGLGAPPAYQIIQNGSDYTAQRSALRFDDTFNVADSSGSDATVVTAITPDWLNAKSVTYKASGSNATTTGSVSSGTTSLTVGSTAGWSVGQGIHILGAGVAGAPLTTTITAISGSTFTLANSASTTVSGATVSHDDTVAIQAALDAGLSNDRTVYLPTGTFYVDALSLTSPNSIHIVGAGPGCTVLRSRGDNAIFDIDTAASTAHSITIENLSFVGSGAEAAVQSNNYGLRFRDTGGQGIFDLTIRNCRFSDCDNSAIKTTSGANGIFTVLLEGVDVSQPADAAGDAIDLWGSNDTTLLRCYVHDVATGRAAYRVRSGSITMIGCNGIDSGSTASWGVFGNVAAEDGDSIGSVTVNSSTDIITRNSHGLSDGTAVVFDASSAPGNITIGTVYYVRDATSNTFKIATSPGGSAVDITSNGTAVTCRTGLDNYCRVTLIGCNVESFTQYGVRCKSGSMASFFGTQLIAPGSGTVTPIRLDYVTENQAGIFDALSGIQTQGASYTSGYAVHSDGLPFVQIGHRDFTAFYDLAASASATLPSITGTRVTGTQNYAMTHAGYQKFTGHLALEEQSSPVAPPSNTGFLYAKDASGSTGLYWRSDGVSEKRIDSASVNLTSTRVAFGNGSNVLTESANLTFDDTNKVLTVSRAGGNPYVFVTDTTNTIDVRMGTLAGAPDRGIIGTMTDDQFVLYQNGGEAWGLTTAKHWIPYAGDNAVDLGTSGARVRDGRFGRDLYLGRQMQTAGSALTSTTSTGAGTSPTVTVAGTAVAGSITLTTGTSPATGAMIVELTVPAAFTGYPVVMLTPANAAAAALSGNKQVFVDNAAATTTKWSIKSGSTALDASTAYIWYFHVIGV